MFAQSQILIFPKNWKAKFKLHKISASISIYSWVKWHMISFKQNKIILNNKLVAHERKI